MQQARRHKILVVDDEREIRELVRDFLIERFDVVLADCGEEAVRLARQELPSVILLDIMMPGMDGILTCQYLRKAKVTRGIPVIMLTAMKDSEDRIRAFRAGADDYIAKPFHPDELIARIESKARRVEELETTSPQQRSLICGNLHLNLDSREALLETRVVPLTMLEFDLVRYLIENKGKLNSRQEIVDAVWQSKEVQDRILDPHILSIRKKLKGFDHVIGTVYGGGYILKSAAPGSSESGSESAESDPQSDVR